MFGNVAAPMLSIAKSTASALGTVLVVLLAGCGPPQPLEQQVLSANQLEYISEDFPPDGGSHVFFFYMQPPRHQLLALLVRQRNPAFGGNPDFQEIWLDRTGGFGTYTDVRPGSALESKVIQLLSTASLRTNANETFVDPANPPNLERLKWVIERIKDRKSKWSEPSRTPIKPARSIGKRIFFGSFFLLPLAALRTGTPAFAKATARRAGLVFR